MTLATTYTCETQFSFWEAIQILLSKTHVVNKRLWGRKRLFAYTYNSPTCYIPKNYERLKCTNDTEEYKKYFNKELHFEDCTKPILDQSMITIEVQLIELLPKAYSDNHAFQLVVLIKGDSIVRFYDVTPEDTLQNLCPDFPYSLQLKTGNIVLEAQCDTTSKSYQWLKDVVLPQFIKWGGESTIKKELKYTCIDSLSLISSDRYYKLYNDLKLKYGKEMVKIWPECTDPTKFVYEDIAIASYLLLLWDGEYSQTPQRFVDLGCGNGLLVYILTKQGHQGFGIDVRKRHIWDMYPEEVKLEVKTITPSDINLYSGADWIIGNHSDELTPWIPVIAARSSYHCNFFVLPCCSFNFDGTKYQRKNSSKSQYTEYLQYIREVCEGCGFNTDIDRLKIPSTKRLCLVGRGRVYPEDKHIEYCHRINNVINTNTTQENDKNSYWIKEFKARDLVEKVRNCTQVDKSIIDSIVQSISNHLLEGCSFGSNWSAGKVVNLCDIVQLICQDKLKALKSECGGLQTLLKNNHHIFMVINGTVQLRPPKSVEEVTNGLKSNKSKVFKVMKLQQKPCWFYKNHPQGCPLLDYNCSFLHEKNL